jgi:hypothetical protein
VRDRALRETDTNWERNHCAEDAGYLHRREILPLACLSDKRVRRIRQLFFQTVNEWSLTI